MEINIDKLIKAKLPLEAYIILSCIYNEEQDKLYNYINNVSKTPLNTFEFLIKEKYIISNGIKSVTNILIEIENCELTDKFPKEFLGITKSKGTLIFDEAFQQLRDHFPIKAGCSERRLQGNIEKCKNLYRIIIVKNGKLNDELHSVILQCINYEINLRTKARSLEYFKLMTTWLNQREWELYIDEVESIIKKEGFVDKKSDINGFLEDV